MRTADRKHRVIVCSQQSDVDDEGRLLITRAGVIQGWAAIAPVKAIRFSQDGVSMQKDTMQPTHDITMNYNPDVNVSVSAWVYEHRLKSPPRWFKVLSVVNVDECSRYMKIRCRLVETSDDVTPPVEEEKNSFGAVKIDIPL
ncbi:head completion protein [Agrobacterium phage Milano]|uniref:Head completion protein n=1 Tax=Agrobacterium phage Milano TaxID=2557550 RepID=A0ACD6BA87_9CAUD|nr:Chain AM, Neck 2 protein, gp15 [Agrobacterium phage Milano]8FWE_AN Chain AN, Neck 2 protein, gp15 [Agrobacterium phage Milano]8FWE_AO Chain AO, Neck 2 protein, gp15 [Agrobacterium phage Milano]8FWE_AP Chain AP, Neck 2 protein, gp15 [Agrobacterium phage Milano]8FWE_H Chain H, Neck 2 protein, gp15 [Agrobacterium phage Milano]8FWE_I Chain I, Neck 2 protein, gp15 [Agrobacterium phage Milano]8FXR_AM Chain AM, Neck 2 protein, gp15 [Agrobacterium phage Milano]8FXR_AN Chain AN, Neck 2 protein, gp